jgi:hypothetical protein
VPVGNDEWNGIGADHSNLPHVKRRIEKECSHRVFMYISRLVSYQAMRRRRCWPTRCVARVPGLFAELENSFARHSGHSRPCVCGADKATRHNHCAAFEGREPPGSSAGTRTVPSFHPDPGTVLDGLMALSGFTRRVPCMFHTTQKITLRRRRCDALYAVARDNHHNIYDTSNAHGSVEIAHCP